MNQNETLVLEAVRPSGRIKDFFLKIWEKFHLFIVFFACLGAALCITDATMKVLPDFYSERNILLVWLKIAGLIDLGILVIWLVYRRDTKPGRAMQDLNQQGLH
jgi:hypothetical protein